MRQIALIRKLNHTSSIVRNLSSLPEPVVTNEWFSFPRETEGNIYSVNWSLNVDGVVPIKSAYRNARIPLLTSHLPVKVNDGKIKVDSLTYAGQFNLLEAGDQASMDVFKLQLEEKTSLLSSGVDLFIEDAGLGALSTLRVGTRIISGSVPLSLIFRNLLIPIPPREVDHRASVDGWNYDERWFSENMTSWNGTSYEHIFPPKAIAHGERPVVAYISGTGKDILTQFQQFQNKIVGAKVVAGLDAPVLGLIQAIGDANCVIMNERYVDAVALPSITIVNGDKTTVIIGGDAASNAILTAKKGYLYGAYHNVITPSGVSALWNGYITKDATPSASSVPVVEADGYIVVASPPDNMVNPPTQYIFIDKVSGAVTTEDAVKRIISLTDEAKTVAVEALLKDVKTVSVATIEDALKLV